MFLVLVQKNMARILPLRPFYLKITASGFDFYVGIEGVDTALLVPKELAVLFEFVDENGKGSTQNVSYVGSFTDFVLQSLLKPARVLRPGYENRGFLKVHGAKNIGFCLSGSCVEIGLENKAMLQVAQSEGLVSLHVNEHDCVLNLRPEFMSCGAPLVWTKNNKPAYEFVAVPR